MWNLYIVLRFLCRYVFLVWLLLFVLDFLLRGLSNCWFFQARLLVLLWWSILYEIAEVIYMFEYFLCVLPQIFNWRINSYIIFCSSLFLSLIHLALLYITLYWLCVLVQIFSTFKSVERLWKILIGGELLYSVLVSVVQQYEAALSIHISPPWASLTPPPSQSSRLSRNSSLSSLCCRAPPH